MERLKESLPLVIIPLKNTKKNYDQTHSVTNSGGNSSEILEEDEEVENEPDCQCYSPHQTWQNAFSPKGHSSKESFDSDKLIEPKSPSFAQTWRTALFCTSPFATKTKRAKTIEDDPFIDESNGTQKSQFMVEQLNKAMSKLNNSTVKLDKKESKEEELEKKLEMAEKRILAMSQQMTQGLSSHASPSSATSPIPFDISMTDTEKNDPLKLGEKDMKIVLCNDSFGNKKQVNTLDNCKLASKLQRKLETDKLRNFSLSQKSIEMYSRDASPKPSGDATPRPSGNPIKASKIRSNEFNGTSKAQDVDPLDPVIMSARIGDVEKVPTEISNSEKSYNSLEDELQIKINNAKEKIFSLSPELNRSSSPNTPMAPTEGNDTTIKGSGVHKVSEAQTNIPVAGKDAVRNIFKESYKSGSSKLQQKLEATKSQIQSLSKELSHVSSENSKFHADLDSLKASVASISATLMDRSKVRIAQLSTIEKRPYKPQTKAE
jgi:hypothetical protein